ncbi:hypothetical protein OJAV_G00203480 [Oryzias javanicus]|uniref:THD domain-containing protein n=1 Tax=Oryzias javanicus TaxID=123683 RepID=A0A437C5C6_ORYJA|nr:hypothetical protein OJAV_G00203480 [Oryzias javanicus]
MAVSAGVGSGSGSGRPSWPVCLLTVVAVALSSVSLLALYQIVALRAEVKELKSDISRRRGEGQEVRGRTEHISSRRSNQEAQQQAGLQKAFGQMRIRRTVSDTTVSQSCLQLLADGSRKTFRKALSSGSYTGIPWQAGLKRGEALDVEGDRIVVREEGLYFVYSQVYYMDSNAGSG